MSELKKAEALNAKIKEAFEANPKETELFVTPDGNCFLSTDKSFAELHARRTTQEISLVIKSDFVKQKTKKEVTENSTDEAVDNSTEEVVDEETTNETVAKKTTKKNK